MLTSKISTCLFQKTGRSPLPVEDISKHTATEITPPLTAMDDNSKPDAILPRDMSSFQSAKARLDRMNRSHAHVGTGCDDATSGNWRRSGGSADFQISSQGNISGQRNLFDKADKGKATVTSDLPGPVWPKKEQVEVAYSYAIRRDDGTYTRLIRADEMDTINWKEIPVSQGPEGLILLPPLGVPQFDRLDSPKRFVPGNIVSQLPRNRLNRSKVSPGSKKIEEVQREIDQITDKSLADGTAPAPMKTPRRTKIYCDKWIHEGVCAFTQLGCKYKHEMPLDKVTQLSLGLNHGLPSWYKRAHAVQLRPETQSSPPSPTQARIAGPWRRTGRSSDHSTELSLGSGTSSSPPGKTFNQQNFGPIAPPPPQYLQTTPALNNPYSMLQQEDTKMEEDGGEGITWSGRRRR